MNKPLITFIIGTRPEAIKLAPLIIRFKACQKIKIRILLTGQHIYMVSQVLKIFKLKGDHNLKSMKKNQSLSHIINTTLKGLEQDFSLYKPNLVILQGDTSTAFGAALAAFHNKIPIAHVEAGLRTDDLKNPYPEEANRRLISQISDLNFAPTKLAADNLRRSDINGQISVTGNTVVDAVKMISERYESKTIKNNVRYLLVTIHRRENWEEGIKNISYALKDILNFHKDLNLVLPLHKNEIVRNQIIKILGGHPRIQLTEPMDYIEFIDKLKNCYFVMTDSGGLQEEAPIFGKPILILRETTERQEGILSKNAKLIGVKKENIFKEAHNLLTNKNLYEEMSKSRNTYGDGNACKRILEKVVNYLDL